MNKQVITIPVILILFIYMSLMQISAQQNPCIEIDGYAEQHRDECCGQDEDEADPAFVPEYDDCTQNQPCSKEAPCMDMKKCNPETLSCGVADDTCNKGCHKNFPEECWEAPACVDGGCLPPSESVFKENVDCTHKNNGEDISFLECEKDKGKCKKKPDGWDDKTDGEWQYCQPVPKADGTVCTVDNNPCTEDVCYNGECGKPKNVGDACKITSTETSWFAPKDIGDIDGVCTTPDMFPEPFPSIESDMVCCPDEDKDGFYDDMCGGNDCDDSMTDDPYIDCPNPSIPICAKPTASCAFCTNPNSEEICANDIDENCDGITFNGVEIITTPGDGQQLRDPKHPTTVQTLTCKATIEKTPDIEKSSLGFVFDIVTPKKSYQKIMGHDEIECSDDGTVCWADHKISQTLTRLGEDVTCSVKSYRIVNGNKEYSKSCESKLAVPICPPDAGHKKIKPEEMEVDDNGNWKDQKELFTVCAPGLVKFIDEAEDSCSSKGQSEAIYKTCLMDYILKEGLGPGAKFMRGYFAQEICCKGGDFIGPAAIYHCDTVSAFGLGDFCTAKDVPENYKPLDYDSLNCIKKEDQPNKKVWITNGPGWKTKNSCYFEHLPATSSLLVLGTDKGSGQGTGTCVDYSIAVTTLLRMGGFKPNEVYTSFIIRHAFNIVKKPGEEKFSVVDVTGNKPPYAYEKMPGDMCLIKDIMNDVKKMTLNIAENDYNLFVKGCLPEGTIVCENIKYNAVTSGGEIKLSPDSQKTLENEIKKNGDVELENIEDLKCLTSLKLKFLSISNIDPLKTLTNLESLYLSSNQILDIDPLKTLTGLRYLHLSNNQYQDDKLSNIDPLKTLTSLRHLKLNSNQISDIDPLKTLTNLEYLALYYNQISDIDPLKTLTNLKELYLYGNQISPQDCADLENYFKGKGQPVIIDGCPTTQPPITGNMITGNTIQKAAPSEIFSFEVSEPELSDSEKIYDIMITLRNPHDSETDITYFVDQLNFEMETIPNVDYDWYYLDDYGAKVFEFTETLGSDETVERDFSISVNQLGEIYFPISVDYGNEVSHSETIIITAECNQNSVCETDLTENYFNCPDCLSGSEDGVCDLVNDGIVDPDCIEGSDFDYVIDACSDGMLSGDEEGVDCGGTCPECLPTTKEDVLKSVNFWILGEKIIQDIIETLRQWIGWF